MVQAGYLDIEVVYFDNGDGERLSVKAPSNTDCFSKDEINTLDTVVRKFEKYTSKQIEVYLHNEVAYKRTKLAETISYEFAKELSLD